MMALPLMVKPPSAVTRETVTHAPYFAAHHRAAEPVSTGLPRRGWGGGPPPAAPGPPLGRGRAVDKRVQLPEVPDGRIDDASDASLLVDVEPKELGVATGVPDAGDDLLAPVDGPSRHRDLCALASEHLGDGPADPASGPGHQRDLASHSHSSTPLPAPVGGAPSPSRAHSTRSSDSRTAHQWDAPPSTTSRSSAPRVVVTTAA